MWSVERAGLVGQSVVLRGLQGVHVWATTGDARKVERRERVVRRVFLEGGDILLGYGGTEGVMAGKLQKKGRNGRYNCEPRKNVVSQCEEERTVRSDGMED